MKTAILVLFLIAMLGAAILDILIIICMAMGKCAEKEDPEEIGPQPPEHINCRCWIAPMDDRVREAVRDERDKQPEPFSNDMVALTADPAGAGGDNLHGNDGRGSETGIQTADTGTGISEKMSPKHGIYIRIESTRERLP